MAEEARLESVYTPKAYPEFESRSLRLNKPWKSDDFQGLFLYSFQNIGELTQYFAPYKIQIEICST